MNEHPRKPDAEPQVSGDPDFQDVARERSRGPADYDESSGNELQRSEPAERERRDRTGQEQ